MSMRTPLMIFAVGLLAVAAMYRYGLASLGEPVQQPNPGQAETSAAEPAVKPAAPRADEFQRIRRPGSVDISTVYDLADLSIPEGEIHTLLPRDAIPSLTDPKRESVTDAAAWLADESRIVVVRIGDEVLGVPLRVLDWHEVVNTTVGGEPIAATYCPLCDSATAFNRRVESTGADGEVVQDVLEFGVSGALYNSNVLMYDRSDMGLWSQLGMHAVSGPRVGTALTMLPVELVPFARFAAAHPEADVVSKDTGHTRDYSRSPYEAYFANERLLVPVAGMGEALPRKTLGIGVATDAGAWFVPLTAADPDVEVETDLGQVSIRHNDDGVAITSAPEGVRTAQTFYYSWSAFYPETKVVSE